MNDTAIYNTDFKSRLLTGFSQFEKELNGNTDSAIHARRREAIEHFDRLGFPTTKNEEWKYTDLKNLLKEDFDFIPNTQATALTASDIDKLVIPGTDANTLVFVNGVYQATLSTIHSSPDELVIKNFSEAYISHASVLDTYFAKLAGYTTNALVALNTAFAQNGTFIYVPSGKVVEKPVIIYHIADTSTGKPVAMPRNLLVAGKNSQASVVEVYLTRGEGTSFTNIVTEIVVQENASLEHTKIQNEGSQAFNIGTTQVYQARDSKFFSVTISLNGAIIRNDLNIVLDDQNCEANLYGLYMPTGKTHIDNHSLVDHAKPHSYSNELYKGILDGKSTGVFNGKIFVRQDAQKTNAFQSNRNILLSKDASMNTKPQLEIFADDVKCSHGATTGQLDEDMLFYLRARGIGLDKARALLMYAFAGDVINQVKIEAVRHYIESAIASRLSE
jgi:Fe-S cluster assembly protein SufD